MTSALDGVGGQRHAPAAFTPGKNPLSIVQEAGWAPGPVWIGAENLASTGIRSSDRPARRQSLYRLRYPAHTFENIIDKITECLSSLLCTEENALFFHIW